MLDSFLYECLNIVVSLFIYYYFKFPCYLLLAVVVVVNVKQHTYQTALLSTYIILFSLIISLYTFLPTRLTCPTIYFRQAATTKARTFSTASAEKQTWISFYTSQTQVANQVTKITTSTCFSSVMKTQRSSKQANLLPMIHRIFARRLLLERE